jgi:hypothetical protein
MEHYNGVLYGQREMTKRQYRKKVVAPERKDVLIVNRFETLCGRCRFPLSNMTVSSCSACNAEFERVTTECVNVTWLPDSIRAQRPDLEWMDFNEYIG